MKKTALRLLLALGLMVLLASCGTTNYTIKEDGRLSYATGVFALGSTTFKLTVDENAPAEKNVTVTFSDVLFVIKEWNHKNIKDDLYGDKLPWSRDKVILTVPAGNNSFTFDVTLTTGSSNTIYTHPFNGLELQYVLEQGKKYQVFGYTKSLGFFKGSELFVGIYDVTKGKTLLKEWKLGETK